MDRLELKQKILNACMQHQLAVMENLKIVMEEAQDSAEEYGLPKDLYDSYRNQLMSKRDMFAQQLQKANEQLEILKRVEITRVHNTIGFGSVVITESQKLFIATGIGKVTVERVEYYVISGMVPFFNAIYDKRKGDSFEFRGKKEKILDVF